MSFLRSRWIPALIWMMVIFATSSRFISSQDWTEAVVAHGPVAVSKVRFESFWEHYWWIFVKGYHVTEFAILTALLLHAFRGSYVRAASFAMLYASSDEFHQHFVPGRGGRVTDVMIDCIGITLVGLVVWTIGRVPTKPQNILSDAHA